MLPSCIFMWSCYLTRVLMYLFYMITFNLKCELLLRRCWKEALKGEEKETQTCAIAEKPMLQATSFSVKSPAPEGAKRRNEHQASCRASCLLQLQEPGGASVAAEHAPAFTKQTHNCHIRSNFRIFPALPQSWCFPSPIYMLYRQGSHTGWCQPVSRHCQVKRSCMPGTAWPWVIHRVGDTVLQSVAISGKHVMLLYSTKERCNESSPTTVLGPSNFIYIIRIAVTKRINLPIASEFLPAPLLYPPCRVFLG